MPWNLFRPKGASSANKLGAGGAVVNPVPVFGTVKDNIDPIRSGRLRVYISDMGGTSPDDSNSWITVNYMTPFFGATSGMGNKDNYGTYLQNPVSYGMWFSPPDIGSTVICVFINGDPNYGYWIGCVPEPETLFMVPAIGSTETVVLNDGEASSYGGAKKLPVSNINSNNKKVDESPNFFNEPKPVHSYLAGILAQQGLIRDTIRGTIGSTSQRESPSRVGWGVNTPGRPIYEGGFTDETIADAATGEGQQSALKITSRRVGHSIVMDDGDLLGRDQLIRLRTSLGHQILMSDDGQTLFIIHANGQSYIELGKEGTIDMYATNSVNVRTQGDLNLHADNNININAKKDLNISADNINIEAENKMGIRTGADFTNYVQGKYTLKTDYQMSFKSSGEASFASDGIAYINGSKVNLNTGSAGVVPQEVKLLPRVAHTDTLYDKSKGWAAAPGKLVSITSRAPAHAPWANANQGVDVKVDNNADANFPSAPSEAVAVANSAVPDTPTAPVTASVTATVPVTNPISTALDKNTTTAMVGQVATLAQTGPAASVIKAGAGVVQTSGGAVAAIGNLAQTPQQLETAGVIKPGSAALVNSLVSSGKTVQQAMTTNLFTGLPGAENLGKFVSNPTAQVQAQVTNFQQAQTQLTQSGIITGKESSGQIAGLVTATASVGLASTVNFLKTASSSVSGAISGALGAATKIPNNLLGSVTGTMSAGNFAANLSSNVTGGLGSIATSLSGLGNNLTKGVSGLLDSVKGVAGSAFAAITKGFPALKAGEPQNLKQIAEKATTDVQAAGTDLSSVTDIAKSATSASGLLSAANASGLASSALNGAQSATTAVTTALGSTTNLVTSAQNVANQVGASLPSSVSSGLSNLPGAQNAVTNVLNNAKGALNLVPGAGVITASISQLTSSVSTGNLAGTASSLINKLKQPGASLLGLASAGLPVGLAAKLNASISSLSSGGAVPITLPTVGVQTDGTRTALDSGIKNLFGNTKIPVPNFGGNPASVGTTAGSTSIETAATKKNDEVDELTKKLQKNTDDIKTTSIELRKAESNLPAGDPGIIELKNKYNTLIEEKTALLQEVAKVLA